MNPLVIVFGLLIGSVSAVVGLLVAELLERNTQSDDYPFFD
jgi:hypothetical protein